MINKFTFPTLSLIALLVFNSTSSMTAAQAMPTNLIAQYQPPPPPSRGAPGKRGTGASRGDCLRSQTPLTALVPSFNNSQKDQDVWRDGKTG